MEAALNPSIIQVGSFKCRADVPLLKWYRVPKKSGISDMMLASVERYVGTIGCIVGTQKMLPVGPRYALRSYCVLTVHPIAPTGPTIEAYIISLIPLF